MTSSGSHAHQHRIQQSLTQAQEGGVGERFRLPSPRARSVQESGHKGAMESQALRIFLLRPEPQPWAFQFHPPRTICSLCRLQKNQSQPHLLPAAPGWQETEVAIGGWLQSASPIWQSRQRSWREHNRKERSKCILTAQRCSWTQQRRFAASFVKLVNEASPTEYCLPVLYFSRFFLSQFVSLHPKKSKE